VQSTVGGKRSRSLSKKRGWHHDHCWKETRSTGSRSRGDRGRAAEGNVDCREETDTIETGVIGRLAEGECKERGPLFEAKRIGNFRLVKKEAMARKGGGKTSKKQT